METSSSRHTQLNDFIKLIDESRREIKNILQELGWNEEDTLKNYNRKSKESKNNNSEDPYYPESYPWKHTVTLENPVLSKKVSNKFSDTQVNFTREEKLLLYEYVIEKTGKFTEPELSVIYNQDEGQKKEMTFAEIVALKRDLKRRRFKYRTTKVPPLSHTEEVRNLIELQMQALCQYLQPERSKSVAASRNRSSSDRNMPGTSKDYGRRCSNDKTSSRRKRSKSRTPDRKLHKNKKSKHRHTSRGSRSRDCGEKSSKSDRSRD